jgi:hypothetical protein
MDEGPLIHGTILPVCWIELHEWLKEPAQQGNANCQHLLEKFKILDPAMRLLAVTASGKNDDALFAPTSITGPQYAPIKEYLTKTHSPRSHSSSSVSSEEFAQIRRGLF